MQPSEQKHETLTLFQIRSEVVMAMISAWMIKAFKDSYLSLHRTLLNANTHNQTVLRGQYFSW